MNELLRNWPAQTLSFLHDVIIPSTVQDAEQLHLVRVHLNTCVLNQNLALKRLHEALISIQILCKELETADNSLSVAHDNMARVRAAIRLAGIPGVKYGVYLTGDPCDICRDPPY
jgi:hypothetical protein